MEKQIHKRNWGFAVHEDVLRAFAKRAKRSAQTKQALMLDLILIGARSIEEHGMPNVSIDLQDPAQRKPVMIPDADKQARMRVAALVSKHKACIWKVVTLALYVALGMNKTKAHEEQAY